MSSLTFDERKEFEKFVTALPFEKSIRRWPDEPDKHAWPGAYADITVEFAWEAWKARGVGK